MSSRGRGGKKGAEGKPCGNFAKGTEDGGLYGQNPRGRSGKGRNGKVGKNDGKGARIAPES